MRRRNRGKMYQFKNKHAGAKEMDQQPRLLAAFEEDQNWARSPTSSSLALSVRPAPGDHIPSSRLFGHLHAHVIFTYTHTYTHTHTRAHVHMKIEINIINITIYINV